MGGENVLLQAANDYIFQTVFNQWDQVILEHGGVSQQARLYVNDDLIFDVDASGWAADIIPKSDATAMTVGANADSANYTNYGRYCNLTWQIGAPSKQSGTVKRRQD